MQYIIIDTLEGNGNKIFYRPIWKTRKLYCRIAIISCWAQICPQSGVTMLNNVQFQWISYMLRWEDQKDKYPRGIKDCGGAFFPLFFKCSRTENVVNQQLDYEFKISMRW